MSSVCPIKRSNGVAKMYRNIIIKLVTKSITHDLCIYIPNISTCPAPNACPHNVSNALPIPSCGLHIITSLTCQLIYIFLEGIWDYNMITNHESTCIFKTVYSLTWIIIFPKASMKNTKFLIICVLQKQYSDNAPLNV